MAYGLLAYELQLLLQLHGSFSSRAGDVVGPEQLVQQQLGSQQKVRLHGNSAWPLRELLASQPSVHLITAVKEVGVGFWVSGLDHALMWQPRSSHCIL